MVKGKGGFYALRERAASYLMQSIGINSQSSSFVVLPKDCDPLQMNPKLERYQLAIRYIDEHGQKCENIESCPLDSFDTKFKASSDKIRFLKSCGIKNAIDWIKSEILAYFCGANEPSGILISVDHVLFVIDNELMFSIRPCDPISSHWFGLDYDATMDLTLNLCRRIARIDTKQAELFTTIPQQYHIEESWSVSDLFESTIKFSEDFLRKHV